MYIYGDVHYSVIYNYIQIQALWISNTKNKELNFHF